MPPEAGSRTIKDVADDWNGDRVEQILVGGLRTVHVIEIFAPSRFGVNHGAERAAEARSSF